jgi:DNA-directed RNA polymerase
MWAQREDVAAFTATRVAAETENDDFAPLVARLDVLRGLRVPGRPALWVAKLKMVPTRELAAAILYHVLRAHIWAQEQHAPPPFLSTVATDLGADLVGPDTKDRDEPLKVGVALLDIARELGIVEPERDPTGGIHLVLADATFRRMRRIINGSTRHVLTLLRPAAPVGIPPIRRPSEMLLDRADVPLRVREAADKVQQTPWRINRAVLAIVDGAKDLVQRADVDNRRVIAEARELAEYARFHFPVFLDFRGRLYQRGGALTYTSGADLARGLLEFTDGEFVDAEGETWLTWHAAQMWGKNDLPFGDGTTWLRVAADIVEADRWREARHPVQFLAAVLAVRDASEGRPVHLPVRVDASCSGLQHLTLLMRDGELAPHVNLWGDDAGPARDAAWLEMPASHRPDDFYAAVAAGTRFSRDEVKGVIVPWLYNAGPDESAIKLAALRRGKDAVPDEKDRADAKKIRSRAEAMAPRAFSVLRWLALVAAAHAAAGRGKGKRSGMNTGPAPIRWTTPSGMEVVQDYREVDTEPHKRPDRRVKITFNGQRSDLVKRFYTKRLDTEQQRTSLQANFVHSLDAALLTELAAASDIDRWAVAHDAFGVPAGRVWDLLEANREAMRYMYGRDRLAEFAAAWRAGGIEVPDPPEHRKTLPPEMLRGLRTLG